MNVFEVGKMVRIVNGPFSEIDDPTGPITDIMLNCTHSIVVRVKGAEGPIRINLKPSELEIMS